MSLIQKLKNEVSKSFDLENQENKILSKPLWCIQQESQFQNAFCKERKIDLPIANSVRLQLVISNNQNVNTEHSLQSSQFSSAFAS